jgi:hypothetical protein
MWCASSLLDVEVLRGTEDTESLVFIAADSRAVTFLTTRITPQEEGTDLSAFLMP